MPVPLVVSDLRQYEYCSRIFYFTHVMGRSRQRPTTFKMQEGSVAHDHVSDLEERRSLRTYGLTDGRREFDVTLHSDTLGLTGRLDMAIITADEAIPIEFKNTAIAEVRDNYAVQLAGYGLLVQERWAKPVCRAFVHSIPTNTSVEVVLDAALLAHVMDRLTAIRGMIDREYLPDSTPVRGPVPGLRVQTTVPRCLVRPEN